MPDYTTLYTFEQISSRIKELAAQISKDYVGKKILLVGVLDGAYIFMADLQRELYKTGLDVEVDFIKISSYGAGRKYSGKTKIIQDLSREIKYRDVLLVEDIIDTGHSLYYLKESLAKKNPKSLKIVALLDKKAGREVEIEADYVGFTLQGLPWVEGYGMDSGELGRGRPEIVSKTK